jgi:hypothetical protein
MCNKMNSIQRKVFNLSNDDEKSLQTVKDDIYSMFVTQYNSGYFEAYQVIYQSDSVSKLKEAILNFDFSKYDTKPDWIFEAKDIKIKRSRDSCCL